MEKEELQRLIAQLHERLNSADTVDEQSRVLLQKLTRDIQNMATGEAAPSDERESTTSQLEAVALKFEADHPKLSMALGELADALGKIGI